MYGKGNVQERQDCPIDLQQKNLVYSKVIYVETTGLVWVFYWNNKT